MKEEIDEDDDKVEVKQVELFRSVFNKLCRQMHPTVIVNGEEKFEVVNLLVDNFIIVTIALDDPNKHLDIGTTIKVNEVGQNIVEMTVESRKAGWTWLKKVEEKKNAID